jgi:hypothetical protein
MKQLTKAQLTVGLLAIFAISWGLFQEAYASKNPQLAVILVIGQLIAILAIAFVLLFLLEWIKVFDLKTNSILTLFVLVTIRLLSSVAL